MNPSPLPHPLRARRSYSTFSLIFLVCFFRYVFEEFLESFWPLASKIHPKSVQKSCQLNDAMKLANSWAHGGWSKSHGAWDHCVLPHALGTANCWIKFGRCSSSEICHLAASPSEIASSRLSSCSFTVRWKPTFAARSKNNEKKGHNIAHGITSFLIVRSQDAATMLHDGWNQQ